MSPSEARASACFPLFWGAVPPLPLLSSRLSPPAGNGSPWLPPSLLFHPLRLRSCHPAHVLDSPRLSDFVLTVPIWQTQPCTAPHPLKCRVAMMTSRTLLPLPSLLTSGQPLTPPAVSQRRPHGPSFTERTKPSDGRPSAAAPNPSSAPSRPNSSFRGYPPTSPLPAVPSPWPPPHSCPLYGSWP